MMLTMMLSYAVYGVTHDDDDKSWKIVLEEDSLIKYNVEDSLPICEQQWNGNLSIFDITLITEMAYALGLDEMAELSQQEMMCLYFDTMDITDLRANATNLSEADCAWQIVYNATDYPYFMHFRNDEYAADVIAIRGTASVEEMMQDFVLYNQVRHGGHGL